jgi:carboxyl-terminal processing protease
MLKAVFYILACLFLCINTSYSQGSSQQQARALLQIIKEKHYSPCAVDDNFSEFLFEQFFKNLDPDRLFFTKADLSGLSSFTKTLDDELNGKSWLFLNKVIPLYRLRLLQSDSIINDITSKPFDFSMSEFFSIAVDTTWPATDKEKRNKWQQSLKYETLEGLANIALVQHSQAGDINKKEVLTHEAQVRLMIKARHLRQIKSILQTAEGFENYVQAIYFDAIATCFDPHTNYFPETEKQNFESSLSKDGYYFGLALGENEKGEASITRLYPGGPAWKTGELNKGDVLLQMKWEGKEPIDLVGADAGEISSLLDASNNGLLELTVKKTNGQIKAVQLRKEKMENGDEDIVKSFVLNGSKKIGYISLPGFYTEWENEGGSSCANDVAKEIVKLKKENINGLILDLRFNGGGSLSESLDLSGIFIEEGPLCLIKGKDGKIITWKDPNRGTIYDGPLLVLVNGQSASASELVAASLQDYNRAIIAGSTTFGKATGQQIFPLQSGTTVIASEKGYAKITLEKIYRVTGKTAQRTGVIPDISIPDIFDGLTYREKNIENSLIADTVKRNAYYKPLSQLPVSILGVKSSTRIAEDKNFQKIISLQKLIAEETKVTQPVSLKWDEMEKQLKKEFSEGLQKAKEGEVSVTVYKADNHKYDKNRLGNDDFFSLINKQWLERLQNDIYVEEGFRILLDYISMINTKN